MNRNLEGREKAIGAEEPIIKRLPLVCILERNGKVYTLIVENVKAETLMEAIKSKTKKGSVFCSAQMDLKAMRVYISLESTI